MLLVPLVLFLGDRTYLEGIWSPVPHLFPEDFCPPPGPELLAVLDGAAAVPLAPGAARAAVEDVLQMAAVMPTLLEGLDDDATERLFEDGAILHFAAGDLLIGEGTATRTLYAVLDGVVEVSQGERLLAVLTSGDVVGELAMLLDRDRSATARAATDGCALALSDRTIQRLVEEAPHLAARTLWNLSRILAYKLGNVAPPT
jgi:CRP-like cAMP-binding protein